MRKLMMIAIAAGALAAGSAPSFAALLYDNGAINGTISAWTINFGFLVADSFDLATASTVTEVDFGVWNSPGDVTTSVDWGISSDPSVKPVTIYGFGNATAVSSTFQSVNTYGYNLNLDSFALSLFLPAGTYFLSLDNAVVPSGDAVAWDETDGPSVALNNSFGYLTPISSCGKSNSGPGPYCSESFQIRGTTGSVPEPASMMLLAAGLAALGVARRRRHQ